MASGPITSWEIDGETVEIVSDIIFSSVQFSSVTQSCPTLCDPMNCSTLGFPVHHPLPELLKLMSIWPSVVHVTVSIVSPSVFHEVMGADDMIFVF